MDSQENLKGKDLFNFVAGKHLGSGLAREVYVYNSHNNFVIKVETKGQSFQNVMEWENWQRWKDAPKVARWLAPCVDISPCGIYLLQERTMPADPDKLPDKLPDFLTDRKRENYGMLKGRLVCHDYAMIITSVSHRERKAGWW